MPPPEDHAVSVSYDADGNDAANLPREFRLTDSEAHILTDTHHYCIDLAGLESEDSGLMRRVTREMDFDQHFKANGV